MTRHEAYTNQLHWNDARFLLYIVKYNHSLSIKHEHGQILIFQ